jgi:hypothetical protein
VLLKGDFFEEPVAGSVSTTVPTLSSPQKDLLVLPGFTAGAFGSEFALTPQVGLEAFAAELVFEVSIGQAGVKATSQCSGGWEGRFGNSLSELSLKLVPLR